MCMSVFLNLSAGFRNAREPKQYASKVFVELLITTPYMSPDIIIVIEIIEISILSSRFWVG